MAWTTLKTWVAGNVLGAAELNEQVRDNGNFMYDRMTPVGGVIMYSGSLGTLPASWKLCDGTEGTPDLRGRFVVGSEDSYEQGDTGGADEVALALAELPSHAHGSGTLATSSNGSHTHNDITRRSSVTSHSHSLSPTGVAAPPASWNGNDTINTGAAGSHTHTISGSTASAGSGTAHENRPPYYALAYIMRVA